MSAMEGRFVESRPSLSLSMLGRPHELWACHSEPVSLGGGPGGTEGSACGICETAAFAKPSDRGTLCTFPTVAI